MVHFLSSLSYQICITNKHIHPCMYNTANMHIHIPFYVSYYLIRLLKKSTLGKTTRYHDITLHYLLRSFFLWTCIIVKTLPTIINIKATATLRAMIVVGVEEFPHSLSDECVPGFASISPMASHLWMKTRIKVVEKCNQDTHTHTHTHTH